MSPPKNQNGALSSNATVQYHLDKLEKAGRITSQKQGLHKAFYFVIGAFEENEKQLLEVLSNETARDSNVYY